MTESSVWFWKMLHKTIISSRLSVTSQREQRPCAEFCRFSICSLNKIRAEHVWLAFNKTCIMLIFPLLSRSLQKLHGRFYLERMGKWWLQHAAWHKKEAKLHIIMFNITFQWAISSFWNSKMLFFPPFRPWGIILSCTCRLFLLLSVFQRHGLQFSGWQRWNGLLGKGSYRHTSFHPNRRPRSLQKHNYPPSVGLRRFTFALSFSVSARFRHLMSVLRSWNERECFLKPVFVLLSVFLHCFLEPFKAETCRLQSETWDVFFIIIWCTSNEPQTSNKPLHQKRLFISTLLLFSTRHGCFVARLRDKIKGTKNGTHKPKLVFKEMEISASIEEYLYEQISWKFRI